MFSYYFKNCAPYYGRFYEQYVSGPCPSWCIFMPLRSWAYVTLGIPEWEKSLKSIIMVFALFRLFSWAFKKQSSWFDIICWAVDAGSLVSFGLLSGKKGHPTTWSIISAPFGSYCSPLRCLLPIFPVFFLSFFFRSEDALDFSRFCRQVNYFPWGCSKPF